MEFGKFILEFRARHNLTQFEMAEILGVAVNTVHRYENNKSTPSKRNKIQIENKMKKYEEKESKE